MTLTCVWVSSLSSPNVLEWTHPVHTHSHTSHLRLIAKERDRSLKEAPMARFCHWRENTGPLFNPSCCFLPAWYAHAHSHAHTCVCTYIHLSYTHASHNACSPMCVMHTYANGCGYTCVHMYVHWHATHFFLNGHLMAKPSQRVKKEAPEKGQV